MVYCVKCGKKLISGAKFCHECGAPVSDPISGEYIQREYVYVGVVKKCPVCGEELPSMVAACPTCGHEINSTQVHPILQKFINELALCDQSIADEDAINAISNEKEAERGWRSWSSTAKTLWIVVNCLTLCVPIVVCFLFRSRRFHKSAPSIKRKANLIENFQIPSERQAIIESLYFIRDKASALVAQKATSDTAYWAKLWDVKSSQIYKKAQTAIPNDVMVSGLYHEITASVQQVKIASKRKNTFWGIMAVAYIVAVVTVEAFVINRISQIANTPGASSFLPIIWGFCATLLLAFFVWTAKKIPNNLKKGITVVICIAVLIFSVRSCQSNVTNFTTQIGNICSDNSMVLSDIDINELTKVASAEIQLTVYGKDIIDKAEAELFAIAREYKFELKIAFVDSNDFTIRESQIDEHGVVKHSTDNTSGVIEFVKGQCAEKGAKLDRIYNYYGNVIEFYIQVPITNRSVMDALQQEIFSARIRFGYSGYKIEFRTMDKYYGDHLRTIEVSADGSISLEERISEFNQAMIDETLTSAVTKCKEQKTNMVIEVSNEHGEILWKSFVDANSNQINVDVYHFRIEAQEICEKNGAIIDNIVISNREMSFNVYVDSRRRGKINKIEEELINAYQTHSNLIEMSFNFWDDNYPSEHDRVYDMDLHSSDFFDKLEEVEQKHKIRDTDVDSSGMISHNNDNTRLI